MHCVSTSGHNRDPPSQTLSLSTVHSVAALTLCGCCYTALGSDNKAAAQERVNLSAVICIHPFNKFVLFSVSQKNRFKHGMMPHHLMENYQPTES